MYVDKLDGLIDAEFFERKAREWRNEQGRLLASMADHQAANQNYIEDGIRLAESELILMVLKRVDAGRKEAANIPTPAGSNGR